MRHQGRSPIRLFWVCLRGACPVFSRETRRKVWKLDPLATNRKGAGGRGSRRRDLRTAETLVRFLEEANCLSVLLVGFLNSFFFFVQFFTTDGQWYLDLAKVLTGLSWATSLCSTGASEGRLDGRVPRRAAARRARFPGWVDVLV